MTHTPFVCLRFLTDEDAEFLYELENCPDVCRHTAGGQRPIAREEINAFLKYHVGETLYLGTQRLLIEIGNGDEQVPVGTVDLTEINTDDRHAEVGIAVLPAHRRKGVALAALALTERLAAKMGINTLTAMVATHNSESGALFRRARFQPIGVLPGYHFNGTEWEDMEFFYLKTQAAQTA